MISTFYQQVILEPWIPCYKNSKRKQALKYVQPQKTFSTARLILIYYLLWMCPETRSQAPATKEECICKQQSPVN